MLGRLINLRRLFGGDFEITISTKEDVQHLFSDLSTVPVVFEIKKASERRSKDANAFAWVLLDKLAEKTHIPKSEIYRAAIKEIGGVSTVVCVEDKAVERLCKSWEKNGLGWQTETMPSKIPGCTNVVLYYGSSTYDTAQMSRLLDLIIQEAEQQGIPTLRDEADRLLGKWGKQ